MTESFKVPGMPILAIPVGLKLDNLVVPSPYRVAQINWNAAGGRSEPSL